MEDRYIIRSVADVYGGSCYYKIYDQVTDQLWDETYYSYKRALVALSTIRHDLEVR